MPSLVNASPANPSFVRRGLIIDRLYVEMRAVRFVSSRPEYARRLPGSRAALAAQSPSPSAGTTGDAAPRRSRARRGLAAPALVTAAPVSACKQPCCRAAVSPASLEVPEPSRASVLGQRGVNEEKPQPVTRSGAFGFDPGEA